MTRKDYTIVADALLKVKKHTSTPVFNDVSHTVAKHLEETCANFNMDMFCRYLNKKK